MSAQPQIDRDSFRATADGFTCRCRGTPQMFHDSDVRATCVRRQRVVAADGTARTHEWLLIRVADPAFPAIEIDTEYTGPDDNFLAPFRDRLLANLSDRAAASISQNIQFDGGPWTIDHEILFDKQSTTRIAIESISGIGWHEGRFCVWQGESDQPALSFAADQENTYLLARLLSRLLNIDEAETAAPDIEPGRSAFEFRDKGFLAEAALGIAGAALVVMIISAWLVAFAGQSSSVIELVLAAATLIGAGIVYWKFSPPSILRLSENALSIVSRGQEALLPLANLAGFSVDWTDYYRKGVYQHTTVRFQFQHDNPAAPCLKYRSLAVARRPKYAELQAFQAELAGVVAARLREEVQSSGRAPWTSRLALLASGIEFTKKPGREAQLIDFSQITNWQLDRGLFKLALDGRRRPDIVEHANQWNFYPGLALFTELLELSRSSSIPPVPAATD